MLLDRTGELRRLRRKLVLAIVTRANTFVLFLSFSRFIHNRKTDRYSAPPPPPRSRNSTLPDKLFPKLRATLSFSHRDGGRVWSACIYSDRGYSKARSTRGHYPAPMVEISLRIRAPAVSIISGRISRFKSRQRRGCNSISRPGDPAFAFYFVGGFGGGVDDIGRDGQLKTYQPSGRFEFERADRIGARFRSVLS